MCNICVATKKAVSDVPEGEVLINLTLTKTTEDAPEGSNVMMEMNVGDSFHSLGNPLSGIQLLTSAIIDIAEATKVPHGILTKLVANMLLNTEH